MLKKQPCNSIYPWLGLAKLHPHGWIYVIREYAVPASQMTIYQGVVQLPWALKPII